ncbi:TlpA family protein disulfide reductase [Maribacter sp. 2308TA10-17]|uniref:TlpA family protein disulfide reductase n=1 Tax=Maribacter sp. 2308TA10-17 TaxID=3386276 RepID=UPI0039BD21EF
MKKQTVFTLLIIALVLSFFVTPLGEFSKLQLNRLVAPSPTIIETENGGKISDYNWKLKDENWDYFNFERSKGKVVVISFWASWHLPSRAQLKDLIDLYETYNGTVDFYLITNEEKAPVEEFMAKNKYTFPLTYQIIGEESPLQVLDPPGSYVLDKSGVIRVHQTAISDWDNKKVHNLLKELIAQ